MFDMIIRMIRALIWGGPQMQAMPVRVRVEHKRRLHLRR
jgi:hypothetical protein